jgi:colanic acid/amylovoran biosynthesis protein
MRILVIGQLSFEMNRLEFGNVGNYYIVQGFFRELKRVFHEAKVCTTLQLTSSFAIQEGIEILPLELYWNKNNASEAREEFLAVARSIPGECARSTFIDEVMKCDLVVDFSGDIWSDNADLLERGRFEAGIYKNRTVKALGVHQVLMASSPGPFNSLDVDLVKKGLSSFDLIVNREGASRLLLENAGVDEDVIYDGACPAFLMNPDNVVDEFADWEHVDYADHEGNVGLIVCGFNFIEGPHNLLDRPDSHYDFFVEIIDVIVRAGNRVTLMGHSNGFVIPPDEFALKRGSDYKHALRLWELCIKKGLGGDVVLMESVISPNSCFKLIGSLKALVSGRIHGGVAGFVNLVPTLIIDYGHAPKAHKLRGFMDLLGGNYEMLSAEKPDESLEILRQFVGNLKQERERLSEVVPQVQRRVHDSFDQLRLFGS